MDNIIEEYDLTYDELKIWCENRNIKNKDQYRRKKPVHFPFYPNKQYKDEWISWDDFLNITTGIIYIYTLHNGDGIVRYVGKTCSPKNRLYSHVQSAIRKSETGIKTSHKENWILKELKEGNEIIMSEIEQTDKDCWQEREIYWISQYDNLTNIAPGGGRNGIIKYTISYEDAKEMIHSLNITSQENYLKLFKIGLLDDTILPKYPKSCVSFNDKWAGWGDYLGHNRSSDNAKADFYLSYEEAKEYIKQFNIKSHSEFKKFAKSKDFPICISPRPERYYSNKNRGWKNYNDFLDLEVTEYLDYKLAKEIIKQFNFQNSNEYYKYWDQNKIKNLPKCPNIHYKNKGWTFWGEFLGTGKISDNLKFEQYYTYEETKEILKNKNLQNKSEYLKFLNEVKDERLHRNPQNTYKKKGSWIKWGNFLQFGEIK